MPRSSRSPEGWPEHCPVCSHPIDPVPPGHAGDARCPQCGHFVWFPIVPGVVGLESGKQIVCGLDDESKEDALAKLVDHLAGLGHVPAGAVREVTNSLVKREQLGSTGIGRGIAIPHATHADIPRLVCVAGSAPGGIDYDSLDGELVRRIFLFLASPAQNAERIRTMQQLVAWVREWL